MANNDVAAQSQSPRFWPLTIVTAVMMAALISLGVWQLQRLAWKEGLIAKLEASQRSAPVSIDDVVRRQLAGEDIRYARVRIRGTFLHDGERYYYAPNSKLGPGYDVYTPFQLSDGRGLVVVNRGFVPEPLQAKNDRLAGLVSGVHEIIGIVRLKGEKPRFTPDNNPDKNLWFWRDFDAMTANLADADTLGPKLGLFVNAENAAPGGWPRGGRYDIELSNRHFGYAITWFGLALTLLGVYSGVMWGKFKK